MEIFIAIGTFAVGILLAVLFMIFFGNSRYNRSLKEAEKEAEVMKKNKMLEVKEMDLQLKAEWGKQEAARNARNQ
jgi:ribonuclease Y